MDEGKTPVYVVHFTQADAASSAQDFTSLKICTREEKAEIAARIAGFAFSSPYGADIRKWLRHGIGLHHAGLLPKYRVLVEQLAQAGLLKVICGTDTLGVGINVPIRTVLFTRLCKFDGQKTAHPERARFSPDRRPRRAARASTTAATSSSRRRSTSSRTSGWTRRRRATARRSSKRKPPEHNFVNWDLNTFKRLIGAPPERLVSRFQVSHGMLLNVLSRHGRRLPRDAAHRSATATRRTCAKKAHRKRAWQLFRALVAPRRRGDRAPDRGRRQAARQRRPAGRLLDGPGAVAVPARDAAAAGRASRRTTRWTC